MYNDPPVFPGRIDPGDRFRERRSQARRRRRLRRLVAFVVLVGAAVALALNARFISGGGQSGAADSVKANTPQQGQTTPATGQPVPEEIRGVHVTMGLASIGKLDDYIKLKKAGLNTIELDIKDEDGKVGFVSPAVPLARRVGAQDTAFYNARSVARKVHAAGHYLIGRIVVFQDSVLANARPDLAIHARGGGVWTTSAGAAWLNPYDERVWDYNIALAEAAAEAGFDEIMFDYVRFPTDGDTAAAVYAGQRSEPHWKTITAFVAKAAERLRPYGVRVSAAVFGLAATGGVSTTGQRVPALGDHLDAVYPMVYPSHFYAGQYNMDDPDAEPGRTVSFALLDFRRKLDGKRAEIIPWLQDFSLGREYSLADVEQQVEAARRAHTGGFLLWNANGDYRAAALRPAR